MHPVGQCITSHFNFYWARLMWMPAREHIHCLVFKMLALDDPDLEPLWKEIHKAHPGLLGGPGEG